MVYVDIKDINDGAANARLTRERDEARETARVFMKQRDIAEADYKTLSRKFHEAQGTINRLNAQLYKGDVSNAFEKVNAIIEAMLKHFKPDVPSPLWGDEGADPKVFDADGVAYGDKIGIGELRYGDLEIASGALLGVRK
jgi:hypothetical protein